MEHRGIGGDVGEVHVLSFEGPDAYARAGGIATRIVGLTDALAHVHGLDTHLWFVGDPHAEGHETRGTLHLHRWCQWISRYHPSGVYDGEEGKVSDYARSLPPWMLARLAPNLLAGGRALVLAEEHQTVPAVLHLDHLLREAGLRDRVRILWNANNTFGFHAIPWAALARAATITTVSRYMRQWMADHVGVESLVIPNGLGDEAFLTVAGDQLRELKRRAQGRTLLTKIARFDPDKRWMTAIHAVAALKQRGAKPLLVARGGLEAHGVEVLERARALGLRVAERTVGTPGGHGLARALHDAREQDVVVMRSHLDDEAKRVLFRASTAVLANSGHEPFGLVGLEAMAAGGVACTGVSGEDYAVAGSNALVVQTSDPRELVEDVELLRRSPEVAKAIRREGQRTARQFAWGQVVERSLFPQLRSA
ncbi:MAG: glycosyltransferase [Sandaracinus sp.]|nr:glycosyltransferase [Sandaracinus sp.]MCB9631161.1 glycosyltransferase [Sandaracinus sp.]